MESIFFEDYDRGSTFTRPWWSDCWVKRSSTYTKCEQKKKRTKRGK